MQNTNIKYKTSTDYNRLYNLLKQDNLVVGFLDITINGKLKNHSKLVMMSYNSEHRYFDLGFCFFERDFDKIDFNDLCKKNNMRFIDL